MAGGVLGDPCQSFVVLIFKHKLLPVLVFHSIPWTVLHLTTFPFVRVGLKKLLRSFGAVILLQTESVSKREYSKIYWSIA